MAQDTKVHYLPPWTNTSIIAIAGSSGSGKTSLSMAIVKSLDLPWVIVLSMVISKAHIVTSLSLNYSKPTEIQECATTGFIL